MRIVRNKKLCYTLRFHILLIEVLDKAMWLTLAGIQYLIEIRSDLEALCIGSVPVLPR